MVVSPPTLLTFSLTVAIPHHLNSASATVYRWRRGSESNRRMQLLQSRALPLGYPATELTLKSYRPSHPRFNQFLPQFVSENLDKALLNHEMHKSCDASEREIRNRLETAPCRMDSTKETLNKSFNHEWTRMNTNEIKASRRLIRVDSCPFVVQSALP